MSDCRPVQALDMLLTQAGTLTGTAASLHHSWMEWVQATGAGRYMQNSGGNYQHILTCLCVCAHVYLYIHTSVCSYTNVYTYLRRHTEQAKLASLQPYVMLSTAKTFLHQFYSLIQLQFYIYPHTETTYIYPIHTSFTHMQYRVQVPLPLKLFANLHGNFIPDKIKSTF